MAGGERGEAGDWGLGTSTNRAREEESPVEDSPGLRLWAIQVVGHFLTFLSEVLLCKKE